MEELKITCPHCGTKNESGHVACVKCGHLFKDSDRTIKSDSTASSVEITIPEIDYTKSIGKPAVTKNGGLVVQALIALLIALALAGGIIYLRFFLMPEKIKASYEGGTFSGSFDLLVYIFLGIELVGGFFFLIPNAIAGNAFAKRVTRTKNGTLGFATFIAVFTRIISILCLLATIGLFVWSMIEIGGDVFKAIGNMITGGGASSSASSISESISESISSSEELGEGASLFF